MSENLSKKFNKYLSKAQSIGLTDSEKVEFNLILEEHCRKRACCKKFPKCRHYQPTLSPAKHKKALE